MGWLEPLLAAAFTLWSSPVTWAEVVAFGLGIAMVFCNMRVNPLAWPLAIASSALYAVVMAHSKLYGMAGLQLVFIAVGLWGWREWLHGRQADGSALRVRYLSPRGRLTIVACTLALWPLLGVLLQRMTDSQVPYLDAFPTAGSLAGQWLLGRQYVENWPAWVIVNLVSIGLFASQALWLTTLLYAIFAVLALAGWRAWARRVK